MDIDAAQVYNDLILHPGHAPIGLNHGHSDYKGLLGRIQATLSQKTAQQQFEFDAALWYGFLHVHGGDAWKKTMVRRLFSLLYYGGLIVNRGAGGDNWVPWASQQIPICSAVSHSARVLIWLPAAAGAVWNWLWAGHGVQTRGAATHGIEAVNNLVGHTVYGAGAHRVDKGVKENKTGSTCEHFGVNLSLGGDGNTNPVSGKGIRENGKHGHLYLGLSKQQLMGRKALLVGVEQSSPIDRQEAKQGFMGKAKSLFSRNPLQWVPDQYGGGHGVGGHSRFSATGGDDFSYQEHGQTVQTNLGAYGPEAGHYYDGLYLDLTPVRWAQVQLQANNFTDAMVSGHGIAP